jgi:Tfp pilus assembly protein PilF
VPVPDLDRPVTFTVQFSDSDQEKIKAQAAELSAALKKDANSLTNWLGLGVLRKAIGDYEGARQAWEYANAIRPKNYVSFSNLGDLYHYYLKDYPKAEENLKQAIKNEPSNIAAYRALADLYTQSYTEKLSEVPNVLNLGLKSNPEHYDLLILMASYYKNAGDKVNAKLYYERALAAADKLGMTDMKKVISDEIQKLSQ